MVFTYQTTYLTQLKLCIYKQNEMKSSAKMIHSTENQQWLLSVYMYVVVNQNIKFEVNQGLGIVKIEL